MKYAQELFKNGAFTEVDYFWRKNMPQNASLLEKMVWGWVVKHFLNKCHLNPEQ